MMKPGRKHDTSIGAMTQPVAIAPAPPTMPSTTEHSSSTKDSAVMGFNCQSCVRKKIKCDRNLPGCSSCRRGKIECVYRAPQPRKRKRDQAEDISKRLALYEHILEANGLLPTSEESPSRIRVPGAQERTSGPIPVPSGQSGPAKVGKLVSTNGGSRYIDSVLLLPAGDGDLCEVSDSDSEYGDTEYGTPEDPQSTSESLAFLTGETVQLAMFGSHQRLADSHPSPDDAVILWDTYIQNVEAICKILHIPTTAQMIERISRTPSLASKEDDCLAFSIYYFSVLSIPEMDCLRAFNVQKDVLIAKYRGAFLQALVNASWLKTTSLRVLQAYVLFLVAARSQLDPHTFWSLTGIAIRLAQRTGLHRDGENLGLPPFEVQMRRRLFWQLLPLDTYAGQVSGTGISIAPESWDTKKPLNINDDQIYPGMEEQPEEQKGATEMMFSLARIELSNFYAKTGVKLKGASVAFKNSDEIEKLIDDVEGLIEAKYLRYCDILNPLHVLTVGVVRSAANVVRLRNRMTPLMEQTVNDQERGNLCALAQKILETDSTIYRNASLKKFQWQVKNFFLWDALLCILFSLGKVGFYKGEELDRAWDMVKEVYSNHEDVLERKRALYAMICDVTLKAWHVSPPRQAAPEPSFMSRLRSQPKRKSRIQKDTTSDVESRKGAVEELSTFESLLGNVEGSTWDLDNNTIAHPSDWMFWDQFYCDTNLY